MGKIFYHWLFDDVTDVLTVPRADYYQFEDIVA